MYKEICKRLIQRGDIDEEKFASQLEKLVEAEKITQSEKEDFIFELKEKQSTQKQQ